MADWFQNKGIYKKSKAYYVTTSTNTTPSSPSMSIYPPSGMVWVLHGFYISNNTHDNNDSAPTINVCMYRAGETSTSATSGTDWAAVSADPVPFITGQTLGVCNTINLATKESPLVLNNTTNRTLERAMNTNTGITNTDFSHVIKGFGVYVTGGNNSASSAFITSTIVYEEYK